MAAYWPGKPHNNILLCCIIFIKLVSYSSVIFLSVSGILGRCLSFDTSAVQNSFSSTPPLPDVVLLTRYLCAYSFCLHRLGTYLCFLPWGILFIFSHKDSKRLAWDLSKTFFGTFKVFQIGEENDLHLLHLLYKMKY